MGTEYSHTYLKFFSKELNANVILESSHGNVHLIIEEKWLQSNKVIKEIELLFPIDTITMKAAKFLQRPYAYFDLVAIALNDMFGIKFLKNSRRSLTCGELVDRILCLTNSPDYATPEIIEAKCLELNRSSE